mgnify:CR=1 FL=1
MVTELLWHTMPIQCDEVPVLDCYIPTHKTSDLAVIILPGGGYCARAPYEGAAYAEFLNEHGIAAFVCQYRVYPHQFPLPLIDARRAIRYVRYHAARFEISKKKIYIMGSSAGGHLAALASTYGASLPGERIDAVDQEAFRPNGQILCYPVIKLLGKNVAHLDSGKSLLGDRQAELGEELSPDLMADENTPKAFIWHTFDDEVVSVINSLDYARRLRQMHVDVEMHLYPNGCHGLGLAQNNPHVAQWTDSLLRWLRYNDAGKL